ncbi:PPOX class F420-dependent oxidoreductase [Kineococcus terrestris]|uniref:PPOX class F420-dependent oxidoreductase n=1 Tax=Kineococcus terrestris TaxID=2044856 RepID=UPI0034DB6E82
MATDHPEPGERASRGPGDADFDRLAAARYVLLTTFRRDGTPVATPVWTVVDGDRLLVLTGAASGKVKRLRREPRVLLAPCRARGQRTGTDVEGRAHLLPADVGPAVLQGLADRYRLQFHALRLGEGLLRRLRRAPAPQEAFLELRVTGGAG